MRAVYRNNGYQEVRCPQILDKSLWEKSGHWEHYKDNMFTTSRITSYNVCYTKLLRDFGVLGFPGVGRQTGLDAGLFEKGVPVPTVFGGDLWKQHPAVIALLKVDAVGADFDLFDGVDLVQGRQDRDLKTVSLEIVDLHRVEAGIV